MGSPHTVEKGPGSVSRIKVFRALARAGSEGLTKGSSNEELEDLIVRRFCWVRERASALSERLIREATRI